MSARRFRLEMPEPEELDIHEACANALDRLLGPPAVWACYPAGHVKLAPAELARLQRVGLKRGWPDFLIVYRRIYGVEAKRLGGVLSKTRIARTKRGSPRVLVGQEEVFPKLIAAGFAEIAVINSVDQMLDALERWQLPLRGRIIA